MQHSIIQSYQSSGGALVGNLVVTGDTEINSDLVLAPSASNVELDVACVLNRVQSMALYCSGDCTVKTNSTSAPGATKTLVAGQPLIYKTTAEATAGLTVDVTKLYLSSTAGGNFSVRIMLDETPVA